ncbi:MAG: universal stress protein [Candidatus Pseudobacter hemicellulosilyticus]|uniref:Universal stress protein n=1 Tax=Candidatus Pseudobacter hemicellulosilyticus TaxID=3121375 RepID=A0AAJ5WU92_9BACT|nr:MAG: universal stress protein [Pseudobacter sp.]
MTKLFNNILVPVTYNRKSEMALQKAIYIANEFQCHVHLLYVEGKGMAEADKHLIEALREGEIQDPEFWLGQWKEKYQHQLEGNHQVYLAFRKGNKEQQIASYILQQKIDLVILDQPSGLLPSGLLPVQLRGGLININRLTRKTGCPVLALKSSATLQHIRNIVLPVDARLPVRKVQFASYLALHFNAKIHLVAVAEPVQGTTSVDTKYLLKTYQLMKEHTDLDVECHTLNGESLADTTLDFARQISADLIVVDAGKSLTQSGMLHRFFSKFIFDGSRIPVMTVAPSSAMK